MTAREVAGTVEAVHILMNTRLRTWLTYPDNYWSADYSEEERRNMREVAAQDAMEHNSELMQELTRRFASSSARELRTLSSHIT